MFRLIAPAAQGSAAGRLWQPRQRPPHSPPHPPALVPHPTPLPRLAGSGFEATSYGPEVGHCAARLLRPHATLRAVLPWPLGAAAEATVKAAVSGVAAVLALADCALAGVLPRRSFLNAASFSLGTGGQPQRRG